MPHQGSTATTDVVDQKVILRQLLRAKDRSSDRLRRDLVKLSNEIEFTKSSLQACLVRKDTLNQLRESLLIWRGVATVSELQNKKQHMHRVLQQVYSLSVEQKSLYKVLDAQHTRQQYLQQALACIMKKKEKFNWVLNNEY